VHLAAQLVKDINTLPGDFGPGNFGLPTNGIVYFSAHDGPDGAELWRSDGTVAGTYMVKDIWPGLGSSFPGRFTTIGSITYFAATDNVNGTELWRTDGTSGGTFMVKDINPGTTSSSPTDLVTNGTTLFFFADDGVHGRELWRSDGTDIGTQLVADIRPGSAGQASLTQSRMAVAADGTLYMIATDGTASSLYKSDGTVGNLTKVFTPSTIQNTVLEGNPTPIVSGNRVYFTDVLGYVWTSDGTTAGTVSIDTLNANVNSFINVNGRIIYTHGTQTRAISGTTVSTIGGTFTINNSNPAYYTNVGGTVYFLANDFSGGGVGLPQPWKITPNASSATLVFNNLTITGQMANVNGTLYFDAFSSTANAYSIWKSDGSGTGTAPVKQVYLNTDARKPDNLMAVGSSNGTLLFTNADSTAGTELWISDGTSNGTHRLLDIYPGTLGSGPFLVGTMGSKLLFSANDGITGTELWTSDGTAGGTIELADAYPGITSGSISNVTIVSSSRAYFSATDPTHGAELWTTDGTPGGTFMVADINPGAAGSSPQISRW
jgi:ELWxxDGT repeat protein